MTNATLNSHDALGSSGKNPNFYATVAYKIKNFGLQS
jgi:hypothetical protein